VEGGPKKRTSEVYISTVGEISGDANGNIFYSDMYAVGPEDIK